MTLTLDHLFEICSTRLEKIFSLYLQDIPSAELKAAMQYTLLNGGKRIRPLLIYATGYLFDTPWEALDVPAAAVELIHTYSLIHDDLPGMDDSDLRRGKPTCHKVFGEGMAILCGDALHTLAMQILAHHPAPITTENRLRMISMISQACGPFGMAGGQALDITLTQETITPVLLEQMHRLKTGALLSVCVELGSLQTENSHTKARLKKLGDCLGFAFQIQDDILDIECKTPELGKPQGLDAKNNKLTYPLLHGLEQAKKTVKLLYQEAEAELALLGNKTMPLQELTEYLLLRQK